MWQSKLNIRHSSFIQIYLTRSEMSRNSYKNNLMKNVTSNTSKNDNPPSTSENSGMGASTMLAIIIGSVVVLSLCLIMVVWKMCHIRKKRKQKEEFLRKSKEFSDGISTNSLRLKTIGSHYQLASSENLDEKESQKPEEKLTNDQKEFEKLLEGKTDSKDEEKEDKDIIFLRAPPRARLESTYLDVSPTTSRRSSRSSEIYNMSVVELQVFNQNLKKAPLASQDSLPSFLEDDTGSLLSTSLPDTVLFQKLNERPSSEGNNLDDMVPALPQKMFAKHLNKSAVNVRHNNINTNFHKKANRLLVSKSAGCIPMDEESSDFVDISSLPLPPKQRPNLPPKQVINKSAEVLQKIDQKFKKSLPEVRASNASRIDKTRSTFRASDPIKPGLISSNADDDDDYYEPPDYDEPPEPREVISNNGSLTSRQSTRFSLEKRESSSSSGKSENILPELPPKIKNSYEAEDYDEPVPLSRISAFISETR